MAFVACSSETIEAELSPDIELPSPIDHRLITISGGRPSGGLKATRSVNEPTLPGICQADKLKAWVYTHPSTPYSWASPTALTSVAPIDAIDVVNTDQNSGSIDRWTAYDYTCGFRRAFGVVNGNHFAIPAIAYSEADATLFTVTPGANYTLMSLTLTSTQQPTPELFFGRLRFMTTNANLTGYWSDADGITNWNSYGYFYYRNTVAGSGTDSFTNPLSGHLYRIVSQINVNITEMPVELVDHLELYMTNVPKSIGLYGNHGNIYGNNGVGRLYPVTAAQTTTHCIDGTTLVSTTNDFTNEEAHLSAFFLPSEVGGELTLRVYYKPYAMKDALGNDIVSRDYPIRPGSSALLTGDNADMYAVQRSELQSGSDLYVYNATANKFYSYANVRVNISGKYENIAAEDQDISIDLEVEPAYERDHQITVH